MVKLIVQLNNTVAKIISKSENRHFVIVIL